MMCMQARELESPVFGVRHPLRTYATNSPRAQARLLVFAMLADGRLDECEIDALDRRGILADLDITRAIFFEVFSDLCSDIAAQLPISGDGYPIGPQVLSGLLDEVSDRRVREKLLKHMLSLVQSDGHLSVAEKHLISGALKHWQPPLEGAEHTV